jgi:hypothetical protein
LERTGLGVWRFQERKLEFEENVLDGEFETSYHVATVQGVCFLEGHHGFVGLVNEYHTTFGMDHPNEASALSEPGRDLVLDVIDGIAR